MVVKKILVPVGHCGTDLKSVHYALALSRRLKARICILQQADGGGVDPAGWLDEALQDLIRSARREGMRVTHSIARQTLDEEIVRLVRGEGIDRFVPIDGGPHRGSEQGRRGRDLLVYRRF